MTSCTRASLLPENPSTFGIKSHVPLHDYADAMGMGLHKRSKVTALPLCPRPPSRSPLLAKGAVTSLAKQGGYTAAGGSCRSTYTNGTTPPRHADQHMFQPVLFRSPVPTHTVSHSYTLISGVPSHLASHSCCSLSRASLDAPKQAT